MKKDDELHILDKHWADIHSYIKVLIIIMMLGIPLLFVYHFFINIWGYPIEIGLIILIVLYLFLGYIVYRINICFKKIN